MLPSGTRRERGLRTWHVELLVVAVVLLTVVVATGGGLLELVGAGAVVLSFAHTQVADRLAENERERQRYVLIDDIDQHVVVCHRWATRYLVGKESLWFVYFVAHHSWSALAGVILFLAYAPWRRWWRARWPLGRHAA